jgi:hypothetical protein
MQLDARIVAPLACLSLLCAVARANGENENGSLTLFTGGYSVFDEEPFFSFGAEYRFPRQYWQLQPIIGLNVIEGGGYYGYAGLRYEWEFHKHWTLAPSFAAGYYIDNDALDLGGAIEFRSAIEVDYHLNDWSSLTLGFSHLSNADLYAKNGGSESFVLGASVDVLKLFGK